jgi:asparagine synthase (glutamine-hydrolysing)
MCGILGTIRRDQPVDPDLFIRQRDTMLHRGPDDGGVWIDDSRHIALASRRLAIVDLSERGHQPMQKGRSRIVYNGELYNYQDLRAQLEQRGVPFESDTDTEVVLAAYNVWGTDCVRRFNGMFAFAIYDTNTGVLFLARDRAGEKPLYYIANERHFSFASEVKALIADPSVPRVLDHGAFDHYLSYGYTPRDRAMIAGIRKLAPAHAMTYDTRTHHAHVWLYWTLPHFDASAPARSEQELAAEVENLLSDAVRRQLVADVPVAILLSGGVDSSLITAAAAKSGRQVKTFTVVFPGADKFNESKHALRVARHFGTDHSEIVAELDFSELLPKLAAQFDDPIADSSMMPTSLVSTVVRPTATVVLGGEGGDELFGGYPHVRAAAMLERARRFTPGIVRSGIGALAQRLPPGTPRRNHLIGLGDRHAAGASYVNQYFDARMRAKLLGRPISWLPERLHARFAKGKTPLRQYMRSDFHGLMPGSILAKIDRATMLSSLEARAPFLDHRLVEFAFREIPDHLKATRSRGKILLKNLAKRMLPEGLEIERKQGFSIPADQWFAGPYGLHLTGIVRSIPASLVRPELIENLLAAQKRGLSNANRLFALAVFEHWRRTYGVSAD